MSQEYERLQNDANYWKSSFDITKRELNEKESIITQQNQSILDMKDEVYKTREELKAKSNLYTNDNEGVKQENFNL